jgi:hypothetical protein
MKMMNETSLKKSQVVQPGSSQPASTAESPPFAEPSLQVLRDLIDETEFILLSDGPDGTKLWKLKISLEQMRLKLDRLAASAPPVQETWQPLARSVPDNIANIAEGLASFLEHSGALHEDDCPGDDTCTCCYERENRMANTAARLLDRLAAAPPERPPHG